MREAVDQRTAWNDFGNGTMVGAEAFVRAADALLASALEHIGGGDAARDDLVAGLQAILTVDTSYSTLRLDVGPVGHGPRQELARNAEAVSAYILSLVRRAAAEPVHRLADIRSSCVGYLWTEPVIERLIGAGDNHPARNLYNEWQWQLVLLRDLLMVFANPDAVRFCADHDGLTRLQTARDGFVVQAMTRRIAHVAVVDLAADFLVGHHESGAFGFTDGGASVLPSVVSAPALDVPAYLLTYSPTSEVGTTFFFPERDDYYSPSVVQPEPDPKPVEEIEVVELSSRVTDGPVRGDGHRTLRLTVGFDEHEWSVDLGQALRGHRYARRPDLPSGEAATGLSGWSGCAVLRAEDNVSGRGGFQLIPTGGQPALGLALLGRLRPGNVVLYAGQDLEALSARLGPDLVLIDVRG
ncbi:hypothetical protein [Kribbella sp. NPDC004875]|uniref:hypothetical protein n=1 Tax=Kribbella sp. NPDC004875 TaxID=3364107 RepID=UPI0036CE728B